MLKQIAKIIFFLLICLLPGCKHEPEFRWIKTENNFLLWTDKTFPARSRWEGNYVEGPQNEKIIHGNGTLTDGTSVHHFQAFYGTLNKAGIHPNHYIGSTFHKQLNGFGIQFRQNQEVRIGNFKNGKLEGKIFIYHQDKPYYKGEFNDGINGQGTFFHPNGETVEGVWKDGKLQQGTILKKDGSYQRGHFKKNFLGKTALNGYAEARSGSSIYQGLWKNGRWHGAGILQSNGFEFTGNWKQGKLDGAGTAASNHLFYEGTWNNNQIQGFGQLLVQDQYLYTGNFAKARPHGYGEILYTAGDAYFGYWEKGLRHGTGRYLFAQSNSYYNGDWANNLPHGTGTLITPSYVYQGDWQAGQADGKGIIFYVNGDVYKGDIKQGKRHGQGIYHYANGAEYSGSFENDVFEGEGKFIFSSQTQLQGHFHQGLPQGEGVLFFADEQKGLSASVQGYWNGFTLPRERTLSFLDQKISFHTDGNITLNHQQLPAALLTANDWYKKHEKAFQYIQAGIETGLLIASYTGVIAASTVSLPVLVSVAVFSGIQITSALIDAHETDWETRSQQKVFSAVGSVVLRFVPNKIPNTVLQKIQVLLKTAQPQSANSPIWDQIKLHAPGLWPASRGPLKSFVHNLLFSPSVILEETFMKSDGTPLHFRRVFGQPLIPKQLPQLQDILRHFNLLDTEYDHIYLSVSPTEIFKMLKFTDTYDTLLQQHITPNLLYAQYKQQLDLIKYTLYMAQLVYWEQNPANLSDEVQHIINGYQNNLDYK